ncbi:tetratricopeptide repeat protein [Actinoplanes sp. NPDC051343]|uniref:tetratricopeptide repeat protein n=1 Tax=Actinoplanes sp. NPDC051343 TaxID=3363906 RepID=UPI0037A88DF9
MSDISLPDALGFLVRVTDDAGKVLGTGISVAPGYVLTSLHAVGPRMLADPDAGLWVVRAGGQRLPAVITYADGQLDLAMVRCVEPAGPTARFLPSKHVEVGRSVEVVVPSPASDERLVLIDGVWQGHGHVAAARLPPGLGIGGSPVVLPADGSVVGLLRSRPAAATGLLVTTGERLERFAAAALSTVPTDLLGLVRAEMGELAWTLLSSGDLGTAAEIHSLLARAAQRTGRLDHAVNFYRAALSAYEETDDRLSAANTLFRLGQVAEMRSQYSVARENYQLAVRGYALTEETRGVATGLQRLGVVTLLDRRPGEAMPLLERAQAAFGLVHDSTGAATTLGYLGAAAAATGDPAAATEYLWRSQAMTALSAAGLVSILAGVAQVVAPTAIRDAAIRALPASALPPEWRSALSGRSPDDYVVRGGDAVSPTGAAAGAAAGAATGAATGAAATAGAAAGPADMRVGGPRPDGDDGCLEPPDLLSTGEDEGEPQIINVWVDERPPDSAIPLVARHRYTLAFRVGAPQPGNLGLGIREIPRSIIPPGGLETSWIVASTDVALSPVSGQSYTGNFDVASAGDVTQWMASFALTVPSAGDSDDRRLAIVPLDPGQARIDVSVCVNGDEYRRLTVELEVASPSGPRPAASAPAAPGRGGGAPRAVTTTEVHGPPLHLGATGVGIIARRGDPLREG